MTLSEHLDHLESRPLIGPGWDEVATALNTIRGQLEGAEIQTVVRVVVLDARLRVASPHEDAVPFLSNAERWARGQGLEDAAHRFCLMWCHQVGKVDPSAVPEAVLKRVVAAAQKSGKLEAEWRCALAIGHADNIRLLTESLSHLSQPHHAHFKLAVLVELAQARLEGGDTPAALGHLQTALQLATGHNSEEEMLRMAGMLGQLRLVQGMHDAARPHLEMALDLAQKLDDQLAIVTHSTLLSGLQLCSEEWAAADSTATLQIPAAVARGNWMAVADGTITRSTCALMQGEKSTAIRMLVHTDRLMQPKAPRAAVNLVRARLAELRFTLGAEVFDPMLQAAKATA